MSRPRVVVLRGHAANPWELRPWELLLDRYDVSYLRTGRGWFDTGGVKLPAVPVKALRDRLPGGRVFDELTRIPGDRYLGLEKHLHGADIVHSQELGYWYSDQAARLKEKLGFKLALTVWETLPFMDTFRNVRTRRYRREVLDAADIFLAATERASAALELEGADPARIRVCPPGVDLARFAPSGRAPDAPPMIFSAGRLVWEKGHQDVLRALARLKSRGLDNGARLGIAGSGSEESRLRKYAHELGIGDRIQFASFVPYDDMPARFSQSACLVLASIPIWSWEEQFGMVIAEAHAAGVPMVVSSAGAIPEVAGPTASIVAPGDWVGLADALAPIIAAPPVHEIRDPGRVDLYSLEAMAGRLDDVYRGLL